MDKNVKESKKESLQYYKEEIRRIVDEINDIKKGEHLYKIIYILEVLPVSDCQRIHDYLMKLYFS